jgi:hypothetical protein
LFEKAKWILSLTCRLSSCLQYIKFGLHVHKVGVIQYLHKGSNTTEHIGPKYTNRLAKVLNSRAEQRYGASVMVGSGT